MDEDCVGRMKLVAGRCVHGTKLHEIPLKEMEKWRWGRSFMLEWNDPHAG